MRSPGWKVRVSVFAAIVAVGGGVIAASARPDSRVARVQNAVAWPDDCADVVAHDATGKRWSHATKLAAIECEHLGPAVLYARFASDKGLRSDLLRDLPAEPTCIAGREVFIDLLEPGQFAPLCRRFDGVLVDAVSALPDILPPDLTIDGMNRDAEATERRDAKAQGRALRRYFSVG